MPILIFLHGLLGDKNDWQKVIEKLPHFHSISLDLPLHGQQQDYIVEDFEQTSQYLSEQITEITKGKPYILIGYSLGGRLALYYALQSKQHKGLLQALILEGVNLGLTSEQDRQQRWQHDLQWAECFQHQPMESVLKDWYQQSVFSHLTFSQREQLIQQRKQNKGECIAQMLRATSLAKQPNFSGKVRSSSLPIYYIVGEKDQKFSQMAQQQDIDFYRIAQAGHNAHKENPLAFAQLLQQICELKSGKG